MSASCNPVMSPSSPGATTEHQQNSTCTYQGQVRVLFPEGMSPGSGKSMLCCYSSPGCSRGSWVLNCRKIGVTLGLARRLTGVACSTPGHLFKAHKLSARWIIHPWNKIESAFRAPFKRLLYLTMRPALVVLYGGWNLPSILRSSAHSCT